MTSVNGHSSDTPQPSRPRYVAPHRGRRTRPCALVWCPGTPAEQRYVFYDQIEIARHDEAAAPAPGVLLIPEPTVSRRHCVVRLAAYGRCYARDVSLNGTRLDGRRMVPIVEVETRPGQVLTIGAQAELVLEAPTDSNAAAGERPLTTTLGVSGTCIATVLVGPAPARAPCWKILPTIGRCALRIAGARPRRMTIHGGLLALPEVLQVHSARPVQSTVQLISQLPRHFSGV